jgi:hypothetical protein
LGNGRYGRDSDYPKGIRAASGGAAAQSPAIIRIANADDRPRVFNAPKFFPATTLGKITVDDLPVAKLCPDTIDIPPKSILEIGVVPLQSGRFPFGGPDIPVNWGSGIAVMYVEGVLIVK